MSARDDWLNDDLPAFIPRPPPEEPVESKEYRVHLAVERSTRPTVAKQATFNRWLDSFDANYWKARGFIRQGQKLVKLPLDSARFV